MNIRFLPTNTRLIINNNLTSLLCSLYYDYFNLTEWYLLADLLSAFLNRIVHLLYSKYYEEVYFVSIRNQYSSIE